MLCSGSPILHSGVKSEEYQVTKYKLLTTELNFICLYCLQVNVGVFRLTEAKSHYDSFFCDTVAAAHHPPHHMYYRVLPYLKYKIIFQLAFCLSIFWTCFS